MLMRDYDLLLTLIVAMVSLFYFYCILYFLSTSDPDNRMCRIRQNSLKKG